jgi:hypothetical protein
MTMATDSVSIAIGEAMKYLDELGSSALFTKEELEKIIRASFASLRASESDRQVLQNGILTLVNRASDRISTGVSGLEI